MLSNRKLHRLFLWQLQISIHHLQTPEEYVVGEGAALWLAAGCVVVVVTLGYDGVQSLAPGIGLGCHGGERRGRGAKSKVRAKWRGVEGRRQWEAVVGRARQGIEMWVWPLHHAMSERVNCFFFEVRREGSVVCFQGEIGCLLLEMICFYTMV